MHTARYQATSAETSYNWPCYELELKMKRLGPAQSMPEELTLTFMRHGDQAEEIDDLARRAMSGEVFTLGIEAQALIPR